MPRKPTRRNPSLRHRPLTFSPFGRSIAMAASSKKARREIEEPKDFPTFSGNGSVNHGKDKMEQSDSSDSEDFEDNKCIIELKDYLLKVCEDMDVIPNLRNLVGEHAKDVGLVVSQRVVNLPPQLLPPLYDALFDEIEWATEDEHKNANAKKGMAESGEEAIIYIKPEDEIFLELSSWSFSFPLHAQQVTTNEASIVTTLSVWLLIESLLGYMVCFA
ncbi:UNVERIFIED_CONTAM: protein BCCIP [Sesamum calycinum]|uniref:Protein BCCIP n=1 Tax=Sesamum calycinum TaxID=2727403 RepID=A0AAW2QY35_9LAMI